MTKNKQKDQEEQKLEPVEMTDAQRALFDKYAERLTAAAQKHQEAQAAFNDVCVLIGGVGCSVRQKQGGGVELVAAPNEEKS